MDIYICKYRHVRTHAYTKFCVSLLVFPSILSIVYNKYIHKYIILHNSDDGTPFISIIIICNSSEYLTFFTVIH